MYVQVAFSLHVSRAHFSLLWSFLWIDQSFHGVSGSIYSVTGPDGRRVPVGRQGRGSHWSASMVSPSFLQRFLVLVPSGLLLLVVVPSFGFAAAVRPGGLPVSVCGGATGPSRRAAVAALFLHVNCI